MWTLLILTAQAADQSVLMVGNSYTMHNGLVGTVDSLLEEGVADWPEVESAQLADGGLTYSDHWSRANNPKSAWYDTLRQPWSWVILQDQSQIPGFPTHTSYWSDSQAGLAGLDALVAEQGGETVLLMTWGRRDGDSSNPDLYPDYETMQDRLSEGYLAYANSIRTDEREIWIAPAGPAFGWVEAQDRATFEALYSNDGSHPSASGSYLAACVIYATLTGRSPVGLGGDGIDALDLLQSAAEQTVLGDPFGEIPYPWAWTTVPEDGQITGHGLRPLLRIDADLSQDLVLTDSRVWILGGHLEGTAVVDALSELRLDGGRFSGTVDGDIQVDAGDLYASQISGALVQTGGTVWVDTVVLGGSATLVAVDLPDGLSSGSLSASQIDTDNLSIPDDLTLSIDTSSTPQLLLLSRSEQTQPSDTASPDTDTGTPTSGSDTGLSTDPTPETNTEPEPTGSGCGCSTQIGRPGPALLGLILALGWRRRSPERTAG